MIRSYTEMTKLKTFEERFEYLKLDGIPGVETFGELRYLNQQFYTSTRWKMFKNKILIRDHASDLGIPGQDIMYRAVIHHINPLTPEQIMRDSSCLMDPENSITCSYNTHNAIHYGNIMNVRSVVGRKPGDTKLW